MRSTDAFAFALAAAVAVSCAGCAAALLAGGAAGGYAAAKDMEDGKLIDSRSSGNDVNRAAKGLDDAVD